MRILFTICGRAGSKGFKNKNLKKLNGAPLVYYTLAAIRLYADKHPSDYIVVALNTDSVELQNVVRNQHIQDGVVMIRRKPVLAGDRVAKVDVIRDTYFEVIDCITRGKKVGADDGIEDVFFDAVVDLDITSPLRTIEDIENAITEYISDPEYDLVVSVVEARRSPYFNMVEKKGKYYNKICSSNYTTRQETPPSFELNASIYVYSPAFLKKNLSNTILDNRCGITVMHDYLVLDIDSEEDFMMMEFLHTYYCKSDQGICDVWKIVSNFKVDE